VELSAYRKEARSVAILRDGGFCMMCYWLDDKRTPFTDVHHVFGRGTSICDKENPSSLMSVCRKCHPQPILMVRHLTGWKHAVLYTWLNMNQHPMNRSFPAQSLALPPGLNIEYFKV
jgi:hypothetical protein